MLKKICFWKTDEKIDFSVKQNGEEYFEKISDNQEEKNAHKFVCLNEEKTTRNSKCKYGLRKKTEE